MKTITRKAITDAVKTLCLDANYNIGGSFLAMLEKAIAKETSTLGQSVMRQIVENDTIASTSHEPMCQDTGMVVVFMEVGTEIRLPDDFEEAVNQGVKEAYHEGYLRKSVVSDPFDRKNTNDNTPAIIHISMVKGSSLKLTIAPKGAGSENMSLVKMLLPADGIEGVKKLLLHTIFEAGGKPCPPLTVGIGIGGNLEKSALMAKEALMRPIDDVHPDPFYHSLETTWLEEINRLGIGPMGFGGKTTALAVKIKTYPCHIASLPVAINIQCHAARHKSVIL
ncbi:MAG: fumarate hydratase [Acholeplasmataceae bacterium]|nr:fumarate hydratase [Acholeplasmataceae bacterium]